MYLISFHEVDDYDVSIDSSSNSKLIGISALWSAVFQSENNELIKEPGYWPFVKGTYKSMVVFQHKGLIMRKAFQRQDITIPV